MVYEMKVIYIFFSIILTSIVPLFGQNEVIDNSKFQFKYLLTYQADPTDVNSTKMEEMLLTVGSNFSKFQSLGGYLRDSLSNTIDRNEINSSNLMDLIKSFPKTEFKEVIVKDYSNNQIIYREPIFRDYFEYKNSLNLFNWTLHQESKEIGGYDCQKGTVDFGGRRYTAWYTKDIPISEGPYKFNGLPGLIVSISDNNNHYKYDLLAVKSIAQEITLKNKNYIVTTQKEFTKSKEEFYENILKKLEQSGISLNFDDPAQKKYAVEKYKNEKRNNPIELTDE